MITRSTIASYALLIACLHQGIAWVNNHHTFINHLRPDKPKSSERITLLASTITEPTGIEQWAASAISWIDDIHRQSSTKSPFAIEIGDLNPVDKNGTILFEWVEGNTSLENCEDKRKVALRTLGEPLMDAKVVSSIRRAAKSKWDEEGSSQSSRFTLQYTDTNSECHLDELVLADTTGVLEHEVDNVLTRKIYPLVRSAFGDYLGEEGMLCVYDSLVIRYDGDKANDSFSASQPLHRDGGMISINIALNSHEFDNITGDSGFEGGGTFFEDLITKEEDENPIVRPSGPGHAVAHKSTVRHAGTPTTSGVREILVFFLTLREADSSPRAPPVERAFHLKMNAKMADIPRSAKLKCFELAIQENPEDAEAHFLRGIELMRNSNEQDRWQEINQSVFHLNKAANLAPFDARIKCFAGIARKTRLVFAQRAGNEELALDEVKELETVANSLENSIALHDSYQSFGISSDFEVATALLSFGEVLAKLKRYQEAIESVSHLVGKASFPHEDAKEDAMKQSQALINYCKNELSRVSQHKS